MFCELPRLRNVGIAVVFLIVGYTLHDTIKRTIFSISPDLVDDATSSTVHTVHTVHTALRPQPLTEIEHVSGGISTNITDSLSERNFSSYVCTTEEMLFQYHNYELVDSSICDSDHPWKLAQMFFPTASVFIDVGANVGYTAAKFFGLWSPGTGFDRRELLRLIRLDALTSDHRDEKTHTIDTVCADGQSDDRPLLCEKYYSPHTLFDLTTHPLDVP